MGARKNVLRQTDESCYTMIHSVCEFGLNLILDS